jgi:hypothetical protein
MTVDSGVQLKWDDAVSIVKNQISSRLRHKPIYKVMAESSANNKTQVALIVDVK